MNMHCLYIYTCVGLLHKPPGFAEGMRFDDQASSSFTALQATTEGSQIVTISGLLVGDSHLEVLEHLSDISEEKEVANLMCMYALSVFYFVPVNVCRKWGLKKFRHQKVCIFRSMVHVHV